MSHQFCKKCMNTLRKTWVACPYCGKKVPKKAAKKKKKVAKKKVKRKRTRGKIRCGKCRKLGRHNRTTCKKSVRQRAGDYPADYRVMVRYKSRTHQGKDWASDRVGDVVKSGGGKGGPFVGSQIRNGQRQVQFIYDTKAQANTAVKRIRTKIKKVKLGRASVVIHHKELTHHWSSWRRKRRKRRR